jgi:hypothetical protein
MEPELSPREIGRLLDREIKKLPKDVRLHFMERELDFELAGAAGSPIYGKRHEFTIRDKTASGVKAAVQQALLAFNG